jgi:hypothetical protein
VLLVYCWTKGLLLFVLLLLLPLKSRLSGSIAITMHEPVPANWPQQLSDLICCLQNRLVGACCGDRHNTLAAAAG